MVLERVNLIMMASQLYLNGLVQLNKNMNDLVISSHADSGSGWNCISLDQTIDK